MQFYLINICPYLSQIASPNVTKITRHTAC